MENNSNNVPLFIRGGWNVKSKGFLNQKTHGEFLHNLDYSREQYNRAFFVDKQQQWPGTKKRKIWGFDG